MQHFAISRPKSGALRAAALSALGIMCTLSCGRYQFEDKTTLNQAALTDAGFDSHGEDSRTGRPDQTPVECEIGTFENCSRCGDSCASSTLPGAESFACVSGACEAVSCLPPFEDCDGDPANGCEADLSSTEHCGGCNLACDLLNASASCETGSCQFVACDPLFGDCDGDIFTNGCERPLDSLTDCGSCATSCSRDNATTDCSSGLCELLSCNNGFGDCDLDASNGCETLLNSVTNCQGCGVACDIPSAETSSCSGGVCSAASCSAGLADCDGDGVTCETSLTTLANCVGCAVSCGDVNGRLDHSTASCATGSCEVDTCDPGFDNCDGTPGNGCETELNSLADCGGCNTPCGLANASESCSTGSCQITSCDAGFDNCDNNDATGCEARLGTDSHCGGCNVQCSGVESCTNGQCVGSFESFTPSNIDLAALDPATAPDVTLDCGGTVTLNTTNLTGSGWCGGPTPNVTVQEQDGGPDLVIVSVRSLSISANTTVRIAGSRPVAIVAFGDATLGGILDVSASGTTSGPGDSFECNLSDAVNAPGGGSTTGGGGGGGGALGASGGSGGNGASSSAPGAPGIGRATAPLTPLLPGCRGGWGGGCGELPGGGGGALQVSVTGTLNVTGSILSNGGRGTNGCGVAGGASGGGSGGAILLEANQVLVTGSIAAGGGDGGNGQTGAQGGAGSNSGAGQAGTSSGSAGGGGGGGSAGRIRIAGAQSCTLPGVIAPAPSTGC